METDAVHWYHEMSVEVPADEVEPVANYIIENISGGLVLEEEDGSHRTTIRFYAAAEVDIEARLAGLKTYLKDINPHRGEVVIDHRKIENLGWIEAYRKSVVPVFIGDSIVIVPPWNTDDYPGKTRLIIEPRMAFGTGRHESTQGCLAALEHLDLSQKTVLDLGCGSGILSIYAALRGADRVEAYDIDPLAVENSAENFGLNGVADKCTAGVGTITYISPDRRYDLALVNIFKAVIMKIIGMVKEHVEPGGKIILAGLMEHDREEVEAELERCGLTAYETETFGGWVTYTVERP